MTYDPAALRARTLAAFEDGIRNAPGAAAKRAAVVDAARGRRFGRRKAPGPGKGSTLRPAGAEGRIGTS